MNLKNKIGGALMATILGAALIGGGSFALFTSQTTNDGNTFTSGGVTITDLKESTLTATNYFSNLAPGDSETWTVNIKNANSLDAWVKVEDLVKTGDIFIGNTPLQIKDLTGTILVKAGETKPFTFEYKFPLTAGNEYQGKKGNLTIKFQAVQVRNNTNTANDGPLSWN